jgi:AcrR family transcriptional regulator
MTTEQRVIEGARRAIASGGWQAATLTRIAEEAGVSRMTLHRHGLGREEIFTLLARDYEQAFRAALWPSVASGGTGAERLRQALESVCEVAEEHLAFLAALDREVRGREGYVEPVRRLLAAGIADGSLRPVNVDEMTTVLVNAVHRTYRHLRIAHEWDERRASERLIELVLHGLLPAW